MEAFIDFAPALISFGLTQTGQIVKTGSELKGFNRFVEKGTTKTMRKGKGWQKSVCRMYYTNSVNKSVLTKFDKMRNLLNIINKTGEQIH